MDIFIIKEQLGHILQAWFSSVLGVKGLPLIVCDMAFSKPNSESVRKKKSLLLFFLTMYCCSALWIFIQKGKYLLMLISLDFLGTIWTEYEHSKHRKSPLWTPMPFLQASDNLLSYLSHSFLWCVSSSGQSFWLDVMIFTPRWEKTFWCNFSSWSCATVSLCYSYIQHS